MKYLSKCFKGDVKKDETRSLEFVAKLCDRTSYEIFMSHKDRLLSEPVTYIVWAVWGYREGGALDETQKRIHRSIEPRVETILSAIGWRKLDPEQVRIMQYLIKQYFVSQITFMIESYKYQSMRSSLMLKQQKSNLECMEPLGRA